MSVTHHRLTATRGALLIIDIQEKLLARMADGPLVEANAARLIDAATLLGMPVWATEQYPQGLGPTVESLRGRLPSRRPKTSFSCCAVPELIEQIHGLGIRHVTLVGIETHVCVLQTALDLQDLGLTVQVAADAVASRRTIDNQIALRRLEQSGVILTTAEAALFEWVATADHPAFKQLSRLVTQFVDPRPSPAAPPV